jgi:hypothetical protein
MMGLKKFKLIELDESLSKANLPAQIEELKKKHIEWTPEAKEIREQYKKELEKEKTDIIIEQMKHTRIEGVNDTFFKQGGLLIGFDESQQSKIGTYARVSCFKFGESQISFENGKYRFRDYMYEPSFGYIEDSYQKVDIYTNAAENFVSNLEEEFKGTPLEHSINEIRKWRDKVFPTETGLEWKHNLPSVGHVADRIRAADELLCTVIRMKQIKKEFPKRQIIFLGDGIAAFRPSYINSIQFVRFFLQFLNEYNLKYYAFSKTCRLREKNTGVFILPIFSKIIEKEPFIVEIPQTHSESNSHLVRLVKREMPALRFDVPKEIDFKNAISLIKQIIPFSPLGYPLCLEHAHKASQLTKLEWRILDVKFRGTQEDPRTKNLVSNLRKYVLP